MDPVLDDKRFRRAMGLFATGVTVISTAVEDDVHAMTANAFTSVSLDPPLILVCLNRGSRMGTYLHPQAHFAVNVLGAEQEPLSRHFAGGQGGGTTPDFTFVEWSGVPRLEDSLCSIACRVQEVLDGGDHVIVLGRVLDLYVDDGDKDPLLFWKGAYRVVARVSQ
jgi:flavin reductase (DIM6/NTAB) family NADH-FMN oxidoreductase RutF